MQENACERKSPGADLQLQRRTDQTDSRTDSREGLSTHRPGRPEETVQ